ncbi:MAG: hypothetical protein QT02_C0001G0062 [archaeon GW2011_AR9]|nr:MAG: hypothetical protein QT02_C0001G0062 [archaeon GW2011_AR9]MBS3120251.1 hypothetical protein [Candidatus Woesearchaeota archaeon]HIG92948.1 hypothetical protein [Candidatus Woesearchaeota archaeon]HIH12681.1 hypothetical protein [Candidatus Woesearchaeota archaeon]
MDIITLIGIVILSLLLVSVLRFLLKNLQVLFYILLLALVAVFIFGISYSELIIGVSKILLWVF